MFTIYLECEPWIHNSLTTHPIAWIATPEGLGGGGGDQPNFGNLNRYQIDQNMVRIISLVKKKVLGFSQTTNEVDTDCDCGKLQQNFHQKSSSLM